MDESQFLTIGEERYWYGRFGFVQGYAKDPYGDDPSQWVYLFVVPGFAILSLPQYEVQRLTKEAA